MLILGIETSGLLGSVALRRNGQSLEPRPLEHVGRRHAQTLVLELRDLLASHGLSPRDVDAVAVSRGPGSFTGLRVGMVCAKTFAYATGCKFVAVDTFAAVAEHAAADLQSVWITEDAQRGDLFVGNYRRDSRSHWSLANPSEIVSAEQFLATRIDGEVVMGRGLERCDLSTTRARCLTVDPSAAAVAAIGQRMLDDRSDYPDDRFDPWQAVPFYIRPSAAEEKRTQPQ